jgi:hypothetical protein
MRALATGSDGLAEINDDDLLSIVLPKKLDKAGRTQVEQQLEPLLTGESRFAKFAKKTLDDMGDFPTPPPARVIAL